MNLKKQIELKHEFRTAYKPYKLVIKFYFLGNHFASALYEITEYNNTYVSDSIFLGSTYNFLEDMIKPIELFELSLKYIVEELGLKAYNFSRTINKNVFRTKNI